MRAFRFFGPLSPFPEAVVLFTLALIASVIFLIVRIRKRRNGVRKSIVPPIVLCGIFVNLLIYAVFLLMFGYGIMTSM